MAPFVHLRVHSAYSLLEGAIRVKELADLCAKAGMPAVAVTDTDNLFGAVDIADTLAGKGIQLGRERDRNKTQADERPLIALLAQNERGWLNLSAISSRSFLDVRAPDMPHITLASLEEHADGLICLIQDEVPPSELGLPATPRPPGSRTTRRHGDPPRKL